MRDHIAYFACVAIGIKISFTKIEYAMKRRGQSSDG
jgi:hypothetical protein